MNWVDTFKMAASSGDIKYEDNLQEYEDYLQSFIKKVPDSLKISLLRKDIQTLEEVIDALFAVSTSEDWRRQDVAMALLCEPSLFEELVTCQNKKYSKAVVSVLLNLSGSVGADVSMYAQQLAKACGIDLPIIARSIAYNAPSPSRSLN